MIFENPQRTDVGAVHQEKANRMHKWRREISVSRRTIHSSCFATTLKLYRFSETPQRWISDGIGFDRITIRYS